MDTDGGGPSSMALALRSHHGTEHDSSSNMGNSNASNAFIDNSNPLNFQLTTLPSASGGGPAKAGASSSSRSSKGKGKGSDSTAVTAAAAPAGGRSTSTPSSTNPMNPTTRNIPAFLNKLFSMVNDPATDPLIRWTESGSSFIVPSAERFGKELLPRFFKHSNFGSFVRQLNMYGFHKVPHLQQGVLKLEDEEEKERAEVLEFRSDNFQRGQPDLLYLIQRKKGNGANLAVGAGLGAGGEHDEGAGGSGSGAGDGADGTSGHSAGAVASGSGPSNSIAASNQHALIKFQGELSQILAEVQAIKRHQTILSSELRDLQGSNRTLWQDNFEEKVKNDKNAEMIDKILKFLAGVFGGRALNGNNGGSEASTSGTGAAHVSGNGNGSNIVSVSVDGDEQGDGDDGLSPAERNVAMADSISGLGLGNYNNGGWQTYVNSVAGQQRQENRQASHQQSWKGPSPAARPGVVRRGASGYEVVKAAPRKRQRLMIEGSSPDKQQRDVPVSQQASGSSGKNKRKEMMPDIMDVESAAGASARDLAMSQFEELHSDDELPVIGRIRGSTAATSSTAGTDSPAVSPPSIAATSHQGERKRQTKHSEGGPLQRSRQAGPPNEASTSRPEQAESTLAGQAQSEPSTSDQQLQLWRQLQDQQQGSQSANGIDWSSVSSILNGTRGDNQRAATPAASPFDFNDPAFLASLSAFANAQQGSAGGTGLTPQAGTLPYDGTSASGVNYSNPSAFSLALSPSNPNNLLAHTPYQNGAGPSSNAEQALTKYNNTLTSVSDENVKLKERMDSLSGAIDRLVAQLPEGFQWDQAALTGASPGASQARDGLAQGSGTSAVPGGGFDDDDFDFEQYLQNANASAFVPPSGDAMPATNGFSLGDTSMDSLGGIGDSSLYSQEEDPLAAYLNADQALPADHFGLGSTEQPALSADQPNEAVPAVKEESPPSPDPSAKSGTVSDARPSTRTRRGTYEKGPESMQEQGASNGTAAGNAASPGAGGTTRRNTRARSKR